MRSQLSVTLIVLTGLLCVGFSQECDNWKTQHPQWIFCDDFEGAGPAVGTGSYFAYDNAGGDFIGAQGVGFEGSRGMKTVFKPGRMENGKLHLGFGRNPIGGANKGIYESTDFREIYWRVYLKMQKDWQGTVSKFMRATVFARSDYSQACIAHLWEGPELRLDPAGCVVNGQVACSGYNDFDNLDWSVGNRPGLTPIYSPGYDDTWYCIEARMKLNDVGSANGQYEYWINEQLEGRIGLRSDNVDFVGSYGDYAINALYIENYWNSTSPVVQERYWDNFVVSRDPIGCYGMPGVSRQASHDPAPKVGFTRFPGTFSQVMVVEFANPRQQIVDLTAYSLDGDKVAEFSNIQGNRLVWNASANPAGVYFVHLKIGGRVYSKPLVRLRS